MNTTFLRFFASVLLLTSISLIAGCGGKPAAAPAPPPAPAVTVAPVSQKEIVEWREFTGHTEPVKTVEVRPRVSGYIHEVRFQSGQLVKQGEVLFVIDPRWNQAVYDQRKAEFDQAQRENNRSAQLLANKAISTEDADARTARFEEARAALESARLDLEYTKVCAPIDGRVSRALLTEGNYVNGMAGGLAADHAGFGQSGLCLCGRGRGLAAEIQPTDRGSASWGRRRTGGCRWNCNWGMKRIIRTKDTSNRLTTGWTPARAAF